MNIWTATMLVIAGVAVHAAVSHALLALSRETRDPSLLALAATSAAVALGAIAVGLLTMAASRESHVFLTKWLFFPASSLWTLGVVWFVAFRTGVQPKRWLAALSVAFGAVLLLNAAFPLGLLHRELGDMRSAWALGAQIMIGMDAPPHPLLLLYDLLVLVSLIFVVFAIQRSHRRLREQDKYLVLVVPLFGLALVIHLLGDYSTVFSHYLAEVGFFSAAVITSAAVQRETARTETTLRGYKTNLEAMVEQRVDELNTANAQLAREIAEHRVTEDSLRRHTAELDMLQELSQMLTSTPDLITTLSETGDYIRDHWDARHVQVDLIVQGPSGEFTLDGDARIASPAGSWLPPDLPKEFSPELFAMVEPDEPAHIDSLDPVLVYEEFERRVRPHQLGQQLLVPMLAGDMVVGLISIIRDDGLRLFTASDYRLARTVAERLAVAVENSRLLEAERRRAAADERDRLARDLHDAVTQSIYAASLIVESLPAVFERDYEEGLLNLRRLGLLTKGALAEMRTLLFELRPATLESTDLTILLERLGEVLAGHAQIPVDVDVDEDVLLPVEVRVAFYRVVQEAFSNVMKHARATRASASVTAEEDHVVLHICDDGRGFDRDSVRADHMGLRIMWERVQEVGARLEFTSTPGRGTKIVVVWPAQDPV